MKKPILTHGCLKQCSDEHRVVPQESYRVPLFSGLRICVTGIPADKRKEMEKTILQNGGKYSANLTKKCSHLISDAPEGDKHKAAKRWGRIYIVTMKWFDQSIAQGACLDEESYPVQSESFSSDSTAQHSLEKDIGKMQYGSSSRAADSKMLVSDCVNSQYLADCRILLVGFEAYEMRKLVNMVHRGGGSRCLSFNDKLTHIVIGNPTEMEREVVISIAARGVVYVIKTSWLEDCDREKKQVPVLQEYSAYDLVFPKANLGVTGIVPMDQSKSSSGRQSFQTDQVVGIKDLGVKMPESLEKNKQEITLRDSNVHVKSTNVFKGKTFCLSNLFPGKRRDEIVQWISKGGGEIISGQIKQSIHYTIECHGVKARLTGDYESTYISSHWIQSCMEDGCLLDIDSHILYSPLPCHVPLPGFESLRFCVSQYENKDRALLLNLCEVLGAKISDELTKEVTHLLCKFTNGPKYEASVKWGIRSVTSEWIFECVKQNGVISIDQFLPKEVTTQDGEADVCRVSQFPTQAVRTINDMPSQFPSQQQSLRNTAKKNVDSGVDNGGTHSKDNMLNDATDATEANHASEIEDLVEMINKDGQRAPGNTGYEISVSLCDQFNGVVGEDNPNHLINPHTVFGVSKLLNRGKDDKDEASQKRRAGTYDSSQDLTESQVVTYEEDFSGRQQLIDRALALARDRME